MTGSADPAVVQALLKTDLTAFIQASFSTLRKGEPYAHNWHIEAIAHALGRCRDGADRRLLITQPPRSLKSIASSVAFVAWALGHDPALSVVCVSYSQDLADSLSRQFRAIVTSPWYRAVFPAMRIRRDTTQEVTTTAGGGRLATSIGGTLTGRGADIIIIDDPLKPEQAGSEVSRRAVIDWYRDTLLSRLNDQEKGVIIVVMQRLHEDDLVGYLAESEGMDAWEHLDLPAIAVADQDVRTGPRPQDVHHRREGDVLHPERLSRERLDALRRELGSLTFSAQYQQRPVPREGNLIRRDWFRSFASPPGAEDSTRIIQSWDVAMSTDLRNDWSVCTTWQVHRRDYYLVDVWRGRLLLPELKRKVVALQRRFRAHTVLIENLGNGQGLFQILKDDPTPGFPRPIGLKPAKDKLTRMETVSARIEAGQVHLPENAPWLDVFLRELLAFPSGRHDDQVDSVSQFLNWIGRSHRLQAHYAYDPETGPQCYEGYDTMFTLD